MTDQFDRAQELDARYTRLALDLQLRAMREEEGINQTTCIECGDEIPKGRRNAYPGCVRCVFCQEDFEEGKLG